MENNCLLGGVLRGLGFKVCAVGARVRNEEGKLMGW